VELPLNGQKEVKKEERKENVTPQTKCKTIKSAKKDSLRKSAELCPKIYN